MLAALIIADEDEAGEPMGHWRVAGRSILQHQAEAVISAGAERVIVCASPQTSDDEIKALESLAAQRHLRFDVVPRARDAASLLGRDDEVLVIAPGLLVQPSALAQVLPERPGLLSLAADSGVPQGYERIDLAHSWAGILRIPAALMARLAQVPPDWQASSALLRIAAQEGVPLVPLPAELISSHVWHLLKDRQALILAEDRFLSARLASLPRRSWSAILVRGLVGQIGSAVLEKRLPPLAAVLAPMVLGVLAVTAVATGHFIVALAVLLLCWFVTLAVLDLRALQSVEDGAIARPIAALLFDALIVGVVTLFLRSGGEPIGISAALAIVLVLSLRVSAQFSHGNAQKTLADRAVWLIAIGCVTLSLGPVLGTTALAGAAHAWTIFGIERVRLTGL